MNESEIKKTAREAAKLVRRGWCQNASARDEYGMSVAEKSRTARSWCASGAIWKASRRRTATGPIGEVHARFSRIVRRSVVNFNDSHGTTAEDVASVFDRIAKGEGK